MDTRGRILMVAAELLRTEPARKVLMADIAKAAGLSRQAVYLHFKTRAELMIAVARYFDEQENLRERLRPSREAKNGRERLIAYIRFWGEYLPIIEGIAGAITSMQHEDDAAQAAWSDRMSAMREGCEMAVKALAADGELGDAWTVRTGTDVLTAMLTFETWQHLIHGCGWSQTDYIDRMQRQAMNTLTEK